MVCKDAFFLFGGTGEAIYCTESGVQIQYFCPHHFLEINTKLSSVSCFGTWVGHTGGDSTGN